MKPFGPGDDHGAIGVAALEMAVVIDLDALGDLLQAERLLHALQQMALGGVLRHAPGQRLAGVGQGVVDQIAPGAADWAAGSPPCARP